MPCLAAGHFYLALYWHGILRSNLDSMTNERSTEQAPNTPDAGNSRSQSSEEQKTPQEGDYRNIETPVNNAASFGDDYESQQEDELTMEEPKTEKEGRTGKS